MSEFLVCVGGILILISPLIAFCDSKSVIVNCLSILCTIGGIFVFGFGVQGCTEKQYVEKYGDLDNLIPAIEVYRGNTTLEITYRDSVAVDTVVVLLKKNGN